MSRIPRSGKYIATSCTASRQSLPDWYASFNVTSSSSDHSPWITRIQFGWNSRNKWLSHLITCRVIYVYTDSKLMAPECTGVMCSQRGILRHHYKHSLKVSSTTFFFLEGFLRSSLLSSTSSWWTSWFTICLLVLFTSPFSRAAMMQLTMSAQPRDMSHDIRQIEAISEGVNGHISKCIFHTYGTKFLQYSFISQRSDLTGVWPNLHIHGLAPKNSFLLPVSSTV